MGKNFYGIAGMAIILMVVMGNTTAIPVQQNYTSELLRLAKGSEMRAFLNENKPPCQNFYKFACGRWGHLNPAPARGKSSHLGQLSELYGKKCAEMLSIESKSDSGIDHKLKDFYQSCRETGQLDAEGLEHIVKVAEFEGGWPMVSNVNWYESGYDWLRVVANMRRKLGVDVLIGLKIVPDFMEKDMNRIMVGAPKMYLDRDSYLQEDKESLRLAYTTSIENQLRRYFPDMSEEWAAEVAQQVLAVEKRLAEGLPNNKGLTMEQTTRLRYTADLKTAYGSYVDINRYLNLIFNQSIYAQVYESPEDYFSTLMDVIKTTPKLTIANYTMWKVLEQFDLPRAKLAKDSQYCVNRVMEYFPDALESMFLRNYHTMQMINELQSVWKDIKKTFRSELQSSQRLTWIGGETKQKANEKLEAMELQIATQDSQHAEQMLKLFMRRTNYYQNLIAIWHWKTGLNLAQLYEKPQDPPTKYTLPHYDYETNKISIPVEFLQVRFLWDPSYPHSILYGTLGYLLAQQMLKGFDSQGRKYDKHGYAKSWWDIVSEKEFDNRAQWFLEQYKEYKFPKWIQTEDKKLINTYVADNGALIMAYKAYQQWWKNKANSDLAEQEQLPLMEKYGQNQLFFIAFAQTWCADYSEDIAEFDDLPEMWRVIGALANFNDFSREFQCELGNKMNPEQKRFLY
ncbi:phosphate-regulating neutral endopeptidase PHEX [Musca domestica]|uniref:Phosphate-regulating neutral endopeptidase PHEX n=1 Tax=Musca domestica TaxID=7370 RepID=A0A9J7CI76_MUSDO|nr:phosphate-regulating neutral endopeptidase PHEX [Musca domestica]